MKQIATIYVVTCEDDKYYYKDREAAIKNRKLMGATNPIYVKDIFLDEQDGEYTTYTSDMIFWNNKRLTIKNQSHFLYAIVLGTYYHSTYSD